MQNEIQSSLLADGSDQGQEHSSVRVFGKGKRPVFSEIQKDVALANYLNTPGLSLRSAAHDAGMSEGTLSHWKKAKELETGGAITRSAKPASALSEPGVKAKSNLRTATTLEAPGIERIRFSVAMNPEDLRPYSPKPMRPEVRELLLGHVKVKDLQRKRRPKTQEHG